MSRVRNLSQPQLVPKARRSTRATPAPLLVGARARPRSTQGEIHSLRLFARAPRPRSVQRASVPDSEAVAGFRAMLAVCSLLHREQMNGASKWGRVGLGLAIGISLAMLLSACGGSAGDPAQGNAGGSNLGGRPGSDGEPEVPRLNGIPVGDCRVPTEDQSAALGCPTSPPPEGTPCDFARGASCAYSLNTDESMAYQEHYFCSSDAEREWSLTQERCGEVCTSGGPRALEFDVADCATRAEDNCQPEGFVYAYTPSGYRRMSSTLESIIQGCAPGTVNFSVSLELVRGCAKRFSTNYEFSQAALTCIRERFESSRYACSEKVPCISYSEYFTDGP